MEPAVAGLLRAQRSKLDALLARRDAPSTERARAIGHLGQLYQAHHLVEAAVACYREAYALELRPRSLLAPIRLADLELDRGEIDFAYALYERARALDASAAATEYGLGRVAAERRSYRQAIHEPSGAERSPGGRDTGPPTERGERPRHGRHHLPEPR
jgi:tetratricopeptide (TPR) repeat protein